jgi:hypothetical protein
MKQVIETLKRQWFILLMGVLMIVLFVMIKLA